MTDQRHRSVPGWQPVPAERDNDGRLSAPGRFEKGDVASHRDRKSTGSRWPTWPAGTACGQAPSGPRVPGLPVRSCGGGGTSSSRSRPPATSRCTPRPSSGQLWQVLTPLLNAGVYFLIFGLLLHINRGIPNYLAFLVTGVFVFNFTQRAFISTSTVITDSLPLIRALQFPRASLPLAYVIIELQQMLLSMVVLAVHRAGDRRADHLVLAARHPGAAPADDLQRRRRPAGGAARLAGQRLQPAAAVPDADLAVRVRRALQHRRRWTSRTSPLARGRCCSSTRRRSTSRWSATR